MDLKLKPTEILVLRDVKQDMTSYNDFLWPEAGPVEASDWEPTDLCGRGLHGLPWGVGGINYCMGGDTAKWLVVKVNTNKKNYRSGKGQLDDKCKFHKGEVVFCGSLQDATQLIAKYAPINTLINWLTQESQTTAHQIAGRYSTQEAGNNSTQEASYNSTQKAGNNSTQKAGEDSTQVASHFATQKACDYSTQKAGIESTQIAGHFSTQKAGNCSNQTAGVESNQTAGVESVQTAGVESTQTAGNFATQRAGRHSTQIAGYDSTQKAGDNSYQKAGIGTVQTGRWYDGKTWKVATRIIDKMTANKWYKFQNGKWEICNEQESKQADEKVNNGLETKTN